MGVLEIIHKSNKGNVDECKKAVFRKFMEVGDRSWTTVVAALAIKCDRILENQS